jgi:hypothetical protein
LFNILGVIEARRVVYIEMKMNSMNNRYLTSIVCLLFLTGIGISSLASVVCIGDDGHIKMEALCQPCCAESESECDSEEDQSESEHHGCCGNCIDLPVLKDSFVKRFSSGYQPDHVVAIDGLVSSFHPLNILSTRNERPPRVDKTPSYRGLDLLSTSILIC